jgi:hypothetical protein
MKGVTKLQSMQCVSFDPGQESISFVPFIGREMKLPCVQVVESLVNTCVYDPKNDPEPS